MVFGLIAAVVLARGSLRQGDRHGRASASCSGWSAPTSIPASSRFAFGMPELADGHRLRRARHGDLRHHRRDLQSRAQGEAARCSPSRIGSVLPTRRRPAHLHLARSCAAPRSARFSACCPAAARCSRRSPPTCSRRRSRKPPRMFGEGDIRGVAAPESANNAGAQTSFIPMLTLGIPSNPTMALMIGALMIQGIAPGPAGDDRAARTVLGPDRQHVDRQSDAAGAQPAAGRAVGEAAARCRTGCSFPRSSCSAASASTPSTTRSSTST